jgi:hypothetical protein
LLVAQTHEHELEAQRLLDLTHGHEQDAAQETGARGLPETGPPRPLTIPRVW